MRTKLRQHRDQSVLDKAVETAYRQGLRAGVAATEDQMAQQQRDHRIYAVRSQEKVRQLDARIVAMEDLVRSKDMQIWDLQHNMHNMQQNYSGIARQYDEKLKEVRDAYLGLISGPIILARELADRVPLRPAPVEVDVRRRSSILYKVDSKLESELLTNLRRGSPGSSVLLPCDHTPIFGIDMAAAEGRAAASTQSAFAERLERAERVVRRANTNEQQSSQDQTRQDERTEVNQTEETETEVTRAEPAVPRQNPDT